LLAEYESDELSEWMAFEQLEPQQDIYWACGMLASIVVNMFGNGRKRYTPQDFMPVSSKRKRSRISSPERDMAILDAMIASQKAR
jgi:hypothetical protein